ncbi:glycosyltransferase family 9 protein [Pontibacter chitinilyticus]|uniref:glycosyltransferase family 9 protein n=1 Tax=Pontibacter chitinilyticus TaxID=2674989 RepID=UPI00321B90EE
MGQKLPNDTSQLWMHYMLNGNFEKALEVSDDVLRSHAGTPCWHLPRHYQYVWNGTPLDGKRVLVRCYHGLGDTLQFIRYAPLLKAIAAEVTVWAQPPLLQLLSSVEGIDHLIPLHDGSPEVEYDVDVEVMELQHIFRTTLATIPSAVPYISVAPMLLCYPKEQLAIGLIWQAGNWDSLRSIPYSFLSPLAAVPGIRLFILQAGAASVGWQEGFGVHPGEFDLYTYASLIRSLDLVITVDSMPAHLAGALGIPVWTLLHSEADWRWMRNRDDSPWYPTMRLFRQTQSGDWQTVISRVAAELEKLCAQTKAPIARQV